MDVIHFTHGATDPLEAVGIHGAYFLPLADGAGDAHVGCVHLDPGARVESPSITHAAALLVVHGRVIVDAISGMAFLSGGMGCVIEKGLPYALKSDVGAIILVVEADTLTAHLRGISSPQRIAGQTWPSDALIPK